MITTVTQKQRDGVVLIVFFRNRNETLNISNLID